MQLPGLGRGSIPSRYTQRQLCELIGLVPMPPAVWFVGRQRDNGTRVTAKKVWMALIRTEDPDPLDAKRKQGER